MVVPSPLSLVGILSALLSGWAAGIQCGQTLPQPPSHLGRALGAGKPWMVAGQPPRATQAQVTWAG